MMEQNQGANPKKIVAVQMLSIGVILFILGVTVLLQSPFGRMEPFVRLCSILSTGAIITAGVLFSVGGYFRLKKARGK
ncbi:MAG TPA: hypothetical protein PLX50_00455 [Candidatus Aminicenantes bacterium]|nr:hypothetical protein [Candidatus Aminicenantes bacterium]